MACIDVHINNAVDEHLSVSATLVGHGLKVNVSPWKSASASLEAFVSRIGGELKAYLSDTIKSHLTASSNLTNSLMTARCSVVCSLIEVVEYLNVTPDEIQWITDDIGVFFDVESNVDWIVVTS